MKKIIDICVVYVILKKDAGKHFIRLEAVT